MSLSVAADASAQDRAVQPADGSRSLRQELEDLRRENAILRRSEQRLQTLLRHASAMILMLDREGTVTSANRRLEGGPLTEMTGRSAMDYLPSSLHEEAQRRLSRSFRSGRPDRWEHPMPNGRMVRGARGAGRRGRRGRIGRGYRPRCDLA